MDARSLEKDLIYFFRKISLPAARLALFVIFFWFGALKVAGLSPATGLVQDLFERTISFMSFEAFLMLFGLFEMLIGVLFVIRGMEWVAISLLFLQLIAAFAPMALLPEMTWTRFMVPTLEGQYIIKNLLIIALAISVAAHLHPAKVLRDMI